MLENIGELLDFEKYASWISKALYLAVKWPLAFWNSLPWWVRWIFYTFIILFAALIGFISWKYREELMYRAY